MLASECVGRRQGHDMRREVVTLPLSQATASGSGSIPADVIVIDQESEMQNANVTFGVLGARVNWRTRDLRDV